MDKNLVSNNFFCLNPELKEKIKTAFIEHFKHLMLPEHPGSLNNAEKQIMSLNQELKRTRAFGIPPIKTKLET